MERKDRQTGELLHQQQVKTDQLQVQNQQLRDEDDTIAMWQGDILRIQQEVARQLWEKDYVIKMRETQLRENEVL